MNSQASLRPGAPLTTHPVLELRTAPFHTTSTGTPCCFNSVLRALTHMLLPYMVWNGAELYWSNLIVPKGDPNAKAAWQFAGFAAQPKPQADFAMLLPYGPANPAARALIPNARLRLTPAWPENEKVMFQHDPAWLAPRLAEIRERWTQWMTG
jgi:Bacterial extracellular solute-binding protein